MQVSVMRHEAYDAKLRDTIQKSIDNLGGLDKFVRPGQRVLLKANLLTRKKPEQAATTHPAFIEALCNILIEHGASVVIGDSPGGPFSSGYMNSVYKATGMADVAAKTGAALNQNLGTFEKQNPDGLLVKKISLTDMLNDVDVIINIAKLKTHAMMTYTGAVKNMFGTIAGTAKAEYHLNMQDYDVFADVLIDICIASNPTLSFIDGIWGMEGNGPAAGDPVHTCAVLASADPYRLDMLACKLIGLDAERVPVLKAAAARGLAKTDLSDIEITGDGLDVFESYTYKPAKTFGAGNMTGMNAPKFLRRFISRYVQTRPIFDLRICNGCGVCKEACPPKIIHIKNDKARLDYKDCIRCYCCQELCPKHAIRVRRPLLSKLLRL